MVDERLKELIGFLLLLDAQEVYKLAVEDEVSLHVEDLHEEIHVPAFEQVVLRAH